MYKHSDLLNLEMNMLVVPLVGFTLLAALQSSTNVTRFGAEVSTVTNKANEDLFPLIAHPDTVELWFQGISHFRAADSKPLSVGKFYEATYKLPLFGDFRMLFHVVTYVPETCIVLESESFLQPRIEIASSVISEKQSNLTMKITFCRTSVLFQYTLGSVLHAVAHHYLKSASATLAQMEEL